MKRLFILFIAIHLGEVLFGQNPDTTATTTSGSDTLRQHALNVFLEGAPDFIKKEIPFLNYVRDKKDADLVFVESWQETGSGGEQITFFIEGQHRYNGIIDTLEIYFYPDDTEELIRERAVRLIKMAMMKYMIDTPLAKYFEIRFTEPLTEEVHTDPWNNWVFSTNFRGYMSGESTSNNRYISSTINAGKMTSDWRLNFGVNYNHSKTVYDYEGVDTENVNRSGRLWGDAARSIGEHWSVGLSADAYTSIYSNYDLQLSIQPAIEYNIFPYSESTRRIFRIYYLVFLAYHDYTDTTQFFKTEETLFAHSLNTSYTTIQKWGEVNVHAGWSNYLHDFSLNELTLRSFINLRLFKGVSLNIGGGYSFIHDQVSLRKGNASVEDVLLHRHELSTTFSFFTHFGFTYTFGSIYNNVVNPRLESIF